ncbi:zinc-binding alcohol dehydrogenase family protein [Armatimonas sp.]|uniref:zinc-binding alcohol dehydrogenase family protein n=1 Tax=Armatimonas sp. TaxID=1872638 RepID=UPI00286D1EBB|nr:zinc-binding alcohol dehydrogenase family protein [Armatimonas sp.]
MRALVMPAPGVAEVQEWPTPEPGLGEVRVKVAAAGICAGDLYIYKGVNPYATYPCIAGHELAGEIEKLGEGVVGWEVGERVVVEPFLGCGNCYPCRIGKSNCCAKLQIIGIHKPGGYAEFCIAPQTHLHRVPDGMSLSLASFAEPLAIGVQSCRRGEVVAGEHVLILGAGPIGLAIVEVVKALGAHPVITDLNAERLAFAKTLGAETLPGGEELLESALAFTHGEGFPVVMEATGAVAAMEQSVELVASGGRVVIVGLVKPGTGVTFPGLDFTRKELTLVGSRASVGCFPEALALLASGTIRYPQVATMLSLWDAPETFATLARNPAAFHKVILQT